jgi:hypothetical protein
LISSNLVSAVKDEAVLPADDGPRDRPVGEGKVGLEPSGAVVVVAATAAQRLQPGGQLLSILEALCKITACGRGQSDRMIHLKIRPIFWKCSQNINAQIERPKHLHPTALEC